jgi:O-antigen/teichoic acid export membrane protein
VRVQVVIIAVMTGAVALAGPVFVAVFVPRNYSAAGELIPWIALGYGVWGLCALPMNAVAVLAGRTTWFWPISLVAAGLKVAGLFLLVPSHGLISAAIMYPVSNAVLLLGVSILAAKTPRAHMDYEVGRIAASIVAALLVVVPVAVLASTSGSLGVAARLIAVALLPVVLFLSPGFTKAERRAAVPTWLARPDVVR